MPASVRRTIAQLPRFGEGPSSLSEVASYLGIPRPVSIRALIAHVDGIPASCDLQHEIVTGAALGGEVAVHLDKDGSYRFSGRMRATGFTSHTYRITALVRRPDGVAAVAFTRSGTVYGTDTPGDREDHWDELGADPERRQVVRNLWPHRLAGGTLEVTRTSELAGVLGATEDVLKVVVTFLAVAYTAGAGVAAVLTLGSELADAGDLEVPTWGGIVGLGVVAGGLIIWGPLAIGPAFLVGVAAGALVESLIQVREVSPEEQSLAVGVFGHTIDFSRVRLTNLLGLSGRRFVTPTFDGTILVNLGQACFDAPTRYVEPPPAPGLEARYAKPGQLFVHELTHVWQLQHRNLDDGWVPAWLCEGIIDGNYDAEDASLAWDKHGIESQATIADRWFSTLTEEDEVAAVEAPLFRAPDRADPFFHYIEHNLRAGSS